MPDASELFLSKAVWDSMPPELHRVEDEVASQKIALAAFLDHLSSKHGLSERHETSLVERASAGLSAFPFLSSLLGLEDDELDPDFFRTLLYRQLLLLTEDYEPKRRRRVLATAQIHWALSADDTRGELPVKPDRKVADVDKQGKPIEVFASIGVSRKGKNLADLGRSVRTNEVVGVGTSGQSLRAEAANSAVQIAARIVDGARDPATDSVSIAIRTAGNDRRFISLKADLTAEGSGVPQPRSSLAPTIYDTRSSLQQQARNHETNGSFIEAVLMRTAIVEYLRRQSESEPGDHEAALASASIDAGITELNAGHIERAQQRFADANLINELLSDMDASIIGHRVRLTVGLALMAEVLRNRGDLDGARDALERSVRLSGELADIDDDHGDMLVASLMILGLVQTQSAEPALAARTLERARNIGRKMVKRRPGDLLAKTLLANSVTSAGLHHISADQPAVAEELRAEAAVLVAELVGLAHEDHEWRQIFAAVLAGLGSLSLALDKNDEASELLDLSESVSVRLTIERPQDRKARFILATTLISSALLRAMADDDEDAISRFRRAAGELEVLDRTRPADSLEPDLPIDHSYGLSLLVIGEYQASHGEDDDAEGSLVRAVELLGSSVDPASSFFLASALETLDDLRGSTQSAPATDA